MSAGDAARFFDTSGCLNLSRPTSGTPLVSSNQRRRPISSAIQGRGQLKIDLYNFEHTDFLDSKYVLTSPRSLEACARLNIKPTALLTKRLADVQDDIGSEKVRLSKLADIRDHMETERLVNLQRCREEREKIIREESSTHRTFGETSNPQPSSMHDSSVSRRSHVQTQFQPSSSLMSGLHQATTISAAPTRSQSATAVKFSDYDTHDQLPPRATSSTRQTVANSILKSSTLRWPGPSTYESDDHGDGTYDFRASSSASFTDDVRRMNKNLQRMSTSDGGGGGGSKRNQNDRYVSGLENVKQTIERRVAHDPDAAAFEKKQYDILLGHYDHELKIQKALENARRTEKQKEVERYELLLHDFMDQSMAEERRQNEMKRKVNRLHQSRQLYGTMQAKNYEQQMNDMQHRRMELLGEIKRKSRRTNHFVKDKDQAANLSRSLAKSSQDLREYLRETNENFHEMAKKADLNSSVLVPKSKPPINRRHLQSSLRT